MFEMDDGVCDWSMQVLQFLVVLIYWNYRHIFSSIKISLSTSWTFCSLFWFVPIRRWYLILSFRYWVSKFYLKSCLGFFKHQKLFYVYQQYFNYYSLYVSLIDRIMLPVLFIFFTVITYFSPWGFRLFSFCFLLSSFRW